MINGIIFRDAIISAYNNLENHKEEVDKLNVFPVPDGDTGTNMAMTISAAARKVSRNSTENIGEVASDISSALMRGARGNSGVILSLLFRGFSKVFKDQKTADATMIADAINEGVTDAYKAVMKPVEGTILTVARLAAEQAAIYAKTGNDPVVCFKTAFDTAEKVLETTPDYLPVLKEAGVVDSGGKGLIYIWAGMLSVFSGQGIIALKDTSSELADGNTSPIVDFEADITFTYCTEFIIKKDPELDGDIDALRRFCNINGDSIVVVDDDEIVKVHFHTNNPGRALQKGLKIGSLATIKIENMREQNAAAKQHPNASKTPTIPSIPKPVAISKQYGFVAVVPPGEGINNLFDVMGCDRIVNGGQTSNPSTDDLLAAIESVPAEIVFVLPNNKNIIMAAEAAGELSSRQVIVLRTKNIPMGLATLMNFDPEPPIDDIVIHLNSIIEGVKAGQVTYASRDAIYDGQDIKENDFMFIDNGKLHSTNDDLTRGLLKFCKAFCDKDATYLTIIYGQDIMSTQANELFNLLQARLGKNITINLVNGGQPIYNFILWVE